MSESEGSSDESGSEVAKDFFENQRRCTDLPCGILFVIGMGALLAMFVWASATGNTKKLSHGIDTHGLQCGVDTPVINRPLLYFCGVITSSGEHSVNLDDPICVSECPSEGSNVAALEGGCQGYSYPTTQVGSRYCLPSGSAEAKSREVVDREMRSMSSEVWNIMGRVTQAWPVLLLSVVVACLMGYVFLFMLKTLTKCIIWICAIIGFAAFAGLGLYLWVEAGQKADLSTTFKVLASICWILAFLTACLVCCCGQALDLSTACMGQAALVIWRNPLLLFSPLVKAIVKVFFFVFLLAGFIHLVSTGEVSGLGRERHLSLSTGQVWMCIAYAFLAFWLLAYVSAVYQFSIAYATAKWFCAPRDAKGKKDVDQCAVIEGVRVGMWYHTGSLAFGSALIAFLELLQRVLEWAEKKSMMEGEINQVTACIVKTLLCCCKCVEGIIAFVNKNVYIDIALTSKTFCAALKSIAHIVIEHGAAMAILNGATAIFQIVGLAAITASVGLLASVMLNTDQYQNIYSSSYLPNPGAAIAVCCILAFIVAWSFMAIFDMTSDTLLICHAEDMANPYGAKYNDNNKEFAEIYAKAEEKAKEMAAANATSSEEEQPHYRYSRNKK
ncbi:unnamed protein product [Effrenium voratum]|uniref:Choline transporter-like protein n=1 Tax=Effrenium voratum TaxID=2562239 RepID=A0AA36JBM9_9DINO|nr:unnamed protein product [Effrenium voratum]